MERGGLRGNVVGEGGLGGCKGVSQKRVCNEIRVCYAVCADFFREGVAS